MVESVRENIRDLIQSALNVAGVRVAHSTQVRLSIKGIPYSRIPRRVPFFRASRARERLGAFLIFSIGPLILFLSWFLSGASGRIYASDTGLYISMIFSGIWIAIGPLVAQQGVYKAEELVASFSDPRFASNDQLRLIQKRIDGVERCHYYVLVPLSVLAGLAMALAYPSLRGLAEIDSVAEHVAGVIVMLQVGLGAAVGIWGAIGALLVVVYSVRVIHVPWTPFHENGTTVADLTYARLQHLGVLASSGSLFVPMLIFAQAHINSVSAFIVWVFISFVPVSGLIFFVVLAVILYRKVRENKRERINRIADRIEECVAEIEVSRNRHASSPELHSKLESLLLARNGMLNHNSLPPGIRLFGRGAFTLIIPLVVAGIRVVGDMLAA